MAAADSDRRVLVSYARNVTRDRTIAEHLLANVPGAAESDLASTEDDESTWVMVFSHQASASPWLHVELGYVMMRVFERGVRVIPLLVGDADPSELPDFLRTRNWIDGRHLSADQLADTVRRAVAAAA